MTLPEYRSRREHSGSVLKIENGALGVELRPFYWKKKNFGPNVRYCVFEADLNGTLKELSAELSKEPLRNFERNLKGTLMELCFGNLAGRPIEIRR